MFCLVRPLVCFVNNGGLELSLVCCISMCASCESECGNKKRKSERREEAEREA